MQQKLGLDKITLQGRPASGTLDLASMRFLFSPTPSPLPKIGDKIATSQAGTPNYRIVALDESSTLATLEKMMIVKMTDRLRGFDVSTSAGTFRIEIADFKRPDGTKVQLVALGPRQIEISALFIDNPEAKAALRTGFEVLNSDDAHLIAEALVKAGYATKI